MDPLREDADGRERLSLREEQRAATRRRILDALVRVMAEGPAAVSVPAVAAESGVSVPTIYRHFGDKAGLIAALTPYLGERLQLASVAVPESHADAEAFVHRLFRNLDRADPVVRAALASGAAPQAKRQSAEVRRAALEDLYRRLEPAMTDDDLDRLARLLVILTCSESLRLWQDRFDVGADDVADHVIWAIRTLLEGLRP